MIEISPAAARRIRALMDKDGIADGALRVGVKSGGCSGLSYVFSWETAPRPDDRVFEGPGRIRVVVDPKSYTFLKGTLLDCDTQMLGQSLVFKNPNATGSCGCGVSFSV